MTSWDKAEQEQEAGGRRQEQEQEELIDHWSFSISHFPFFILRL